MRPCERCKHNLSEHAEELGEGYTRPCCRYGCGCACFTDEQQRQAAAAIVGKPEKAPAGYVH